MQRPSRITDLTGVATHVDDRLLDFRQAPAVAIVEQETALGTKGILTEVALGTPGRFAAFDDLVTLTVRAADGDERHGPFLPKGGYEDEAQCDINLSLSPLLKHYPLMDVVVGDLLVLKPCGAEKLVRPELMRGHWTQTRIGAQL